MSAGVQSDLGSVRKRYRLQAADTRRVALLPIELHDNQVETPDNGGNYSRGQREYTLPWLRRCIRFHLRRFRHVTGSGEAPCATRRDDARRATGTQRAKSVCLLQGRVESQIGNSMGGRLVQPGIQLLL